MSLIFNKIDTFYKNNTPFVVYRKPNSKEISGLFMKDSLLHYTKDFTESGFVFAPFNIKEKAILFPLNAAEFCQEELVFKNELWLNNNFKDDDVVSKEKHIFLVEKAIERIDKKELQKVVISRQEIFEIDAFDILEIYHKLLQTYTNAFVYVWFHPKVGLWLGATPETLLNISNNVFTTMSLAGTQVFEESKPVVWKPKELNEQQLVTNFIASQLKDITTDLKIDKQETVKAGNLLHLKTKVSGKLNIQKSNLKSLIRALHPTPAVCGLPRQKANDFILDNEDYHRSFYTGFLGELNLPDSLLYVNLRCMQIRNNLASIYIGGGITKDSNTKKEWEETVAKSRTMKRVL